MREDSALAGEAVAGSVDPNDEGRSPALRRRRRSARGSGTTIRRRRLRLVYFALASIWGFLAGAVAIVIGLAVTEQPVQFAPWIVIALGVAALAAVVGGAVAAAAYRDAVG